MMLRNILNVPKKLNTIPQRSFFFKSKGNYDLTSPLINAGMLGATFIAVTAGVVSYQLGIKTGQNKAVNPNDEKIETSSIIRKP